MIQIQNNTYPKISIQEGVNSQGNPFVVKRIMDKQIKQNQYGNPVDITVLKTYYTSVNKDLVKKHHSKTGKKETEEKHIYEVHKSVMKNIVDKIIKAKKEHNSISTKKASPKKASHKQSSSKKSSPKKAINKKTVSKKNGLKKNVSKKNVSKKPITKKSSSKKKVLKIRNSDGKVYKVHKGKLGGHYFIKNGKKIYIKHKKDNKD